VEASSSWSRHLRASLAELDVYDVPPARAEARMHANECPEPWPAEVMDALAEVVRNLELGRYPDTSGRRLRSILGERHGCDAARVVLGNGSDEIISIVLTALSGGPSGPGAVVVPIPTFVMYDHVARVLGMPVREVLVDESLQLPFDAMDRALVGAAVCFLARPNNPTGALWDARVIEQLVTRHRATVFVIDEAYAAYAPGESLWRPDLPDNVVFMSTLSKVGLAALRVGYCIANPDLAHALDKVRHPYNVSQTSLALAEAVLTRFADVQAEMIARTIANRERLRDILSRVPGAAVHPSSANLVLIRLSDPSQAPALRAHLAAHDVLIKDVSHLPRLEGCLRASVGTTAELDQLEEALGKWRCP
jgi:histidinol-phosphate aminotransferase